MYDFTEVFEQLSSKICWIQNYTGHHIPIEELEKHLLSDAAQNVLEMGKKPLIIKQALELILSTNSKHFELTCTGCTLF